MTSGEDTPGGPRRKPSHWRYLRAHIECVEQLGAPTLGNLAKILKCSRQAVWAFQKRHPDLLSWVDDTLKAVNANYFALVQRKMAFLGMQGSVAHAEAFFKSLNGVYAREADAAAAAATPGQFTLNLLIPRPEMPNVTPAHALPPSSQALAQLSTAIPTVAVTR